MMCARRSSLTCGIGARLASSIMATTSGHPSPLYQLFPGSTILLLFVLGHAHHDPRSVSGEFRLSEECVAFRRLRRPSRARRGTVERRPPARVADARRKGLHLVPARIQLDDLAVSRISDEGIAARQALHVAQGAAGAAAPVVLDHRGRE